MWSFERFKLFDAHFHIIDYRFPIFDNQGYKPGEFTVEMYLKEMERYNLCGGAVVSGSFNGFDRKYLIDSLNKLGPAFVGVIQLSHNVSDDEIIRLNNAGIRGVRFNLKRGGSEKIDFLMDMACRIFDLAGWHVDLYVDYGQLEELESVVGGLPKVVIDHFGMSKGDLRVLLRLVEKGVFVKASGFGRVDLDIVEALKELYTVNPKSLMFGSDLPSTRAKRPYRHDDFLAVIKSLGDKASSQVFYDNAIDFYRPKAV